MMWLAFAAAVYGQAVIPMQFRGEWNSRLSACGTADWDPLSIDRASLAFDEYSIKARRILRDNNRGITVFGTFEAEGHGGDRVTRLSLSRSGSELTIKDGRDVTRFHRCPLKGASKHNA